MASWVQRPEPLQAGSTVLLRRILLRSLLGILSGSTRRFALVTLPDCLPNDEPPPMRFASA
jgi:hypothetical protein